MIHTRKGKRQRQQVTHKEGNEENSRKGKRQKVRHKEGRNSYAQGRNEENSRKGLIFSRRFDIHFGALFSDQIIDLVKLIYFNCFNCLSFYPFHSHSHEKIIKMMSIQVIVMFMTAFFLFQMWTKKEVKERVDTKEKKEDKERVDTKEKKEDKESVDTKEKKEVESTEKEQKIKNPCDFQVFRDLCVIILETDSSQKCYNLPMSRSPIHTVAFFILFAIIDQTERESVMKRLNSEGEYFSLSFSLPDLIFFIERFDWTSVPTDFISIKTNRKTLTAIRSNLKKSFPQISFETYFVEEAIEEVIVLTTIKFEPIWKSEFQQVNDEWSIPTTTAKIIGRLPSQSTENDLFRFVYEGENAGVDLFIEGKEDKNVSFAETDIDTGIYNVFIGSHIKSLLIEQIKVKLAGKLSFSKEGLSFDQRQECIILESYSPPKSKLVLKNLRIYLPRVGVIALFNSDKTDVKKQSMDIAIDENYDFKIEIIARNDRDNVMLLCTENPKIEDIIKNSMIF